ncbi:helix-turn-helix domain-containing protein [Gilliamella apis]
MLDVDRLEKHISDALGIPLHELWPSRYVRGKR